VDGAVYIVVPVANPLAIDGGRGVVSDFAVARVVVDRAVLAIGHVRVSVSVVTAPVVAVALIVAVMVVMMVTAVTVPGLRTERRSADEQADSEGTELFHVLSP
jgi:hypothetical protein